MYCEYFGLHESPFSIAPNPRYLFMSEQHQEALAHLLYGIHIDGGFVLLTGEVGTGKTTVSRQLLEQLPADTDVAVLLNPRVSPVELLQSICEELRIPLDDGQVPTTKGLVDRISHYLLESHARGRNTLLMIDEAQQMTVELLEQVRLLTNLETSEHKLLRIVLLGQPELLELLAGSELRQLSQRITARYHLGPLSSAELPLYIRHRLAIAGLDRPVFTPAAMKQLYRLSGGLPRVINLICDRALLGAFVQKQNEVSVKTLKQAAHEVLGDALPVALPAGIGRRWILGSALAIGLLAWAVGFGLSLLYKGPVDNWLKPVLAWVEQVPDQLQGKTGDQVLAATGSQAGASPEQAAVVSLPAQVPVTGSAAKAEVVPSISLSPASAKPAVPDVPNEPPVSEVAAVELPTASPEMPVPQARDTVPDLWPPITDADLAQVLAYRQLFGQWAVNYDPRHDPVVCDFAQSQGLGCLTLSGAPALLQVLDRPAVTKLRHDGLLVDVVIEALNDESALLFVAGKQLTLSRSGLERAWSGEFTLLWRLPPGYQAPLWPGARGATVSWLDVQLARIEGQVMARGARQLYDGKMVEQVRSFQQKKGLNVDGVVGPRTLISINSETQSDLPHLGIR